MRNISRRNSIRTIKLFPPSEPSGRGMLAVDEINSIYWEVAGNPKGRPALVLHGGPGSGSSPNTRRMFDPALYRIVLFDQRGCGKSRPLASEVGADLGSNNTHALISDIEKLRIHLQVESWLLLGFSWGTTLALAYAQAHPQRVRAIVLACVTTTSRREVDWITRGVRPIFPIEWERFVAVIPPRLRHLSICDAYATLLFDPDRAVRAHSAREWCAWEDTHMSLSPGHTPALSERDPAFRLLFARLVTHYWRHAAFLEDEQLIRNVGLLEGIPGVLMNGLYDVSGPLDTAWRLNQGWQSSRLQVIRDAGHGSSDNFQTALLTALEEFSH